MRGEVDVVGGEAIAANRVHVGVLVGSIRLVDVVVKGSTHAGHS